MASIAMTDLVTIAGISNEEEYITSGFALIANRAINSFGAGPWFTLALAGCVFDFSILLFRFRHNRKLNRINIKTRNCSRLGVLLVLLKVLAFALICVVISASTSPPLKIRGPSSLEATVILISGLLVSALVVSFKFWKQLNRVCACLAYPLGIVSTLSSYVFVGLVYCFLHSDLLEVKHEEMVLMIVLSVCSLSFIINVFFSFGLYKRFKKIFRPSRISPEYH